jgi:hypothetical protein
MKLIAQLTSAVKTYPYRKRLPFALSMICVFVYATLRSGPYSSDLDRRIDVIGTAALILLFFSGYRGRPFWFFGGIVAGLFVLELFTRLHVLGSH